MKPIYDRPSPQAAAVTAHRTTVSGESGATDIAAYRLPVK